MREIISKITKICKIDFNDADILNLSSDDIRRIKMVNTISMIGILNLSLYGIIYSIIDFSTYFTAIAFYFSSALLTFVIIIINKKQLFSLAKILIILLFPTYLTINSTLLFGKAANSQVYILLFALIPLFVYSFKQKGNLIFFVGLNLIVYLAIEFFPSFSKPIYSLPSDYVEFFRSMNVFVAFAGAFIAIIYFKKFSNEKEEQLIKQSEELKISQQHRDLVYSIIAHDLRTPFNGLMGVSDLLVSKFDEYDDEKVKKLHLAMNQSATKLNDLLVNLLDWAKMQSGNLKTNFQPFKLNQPVDEVILILKELSEAKGLKISNNIEDDVMVFADLYMVSTIIRNLLSNAIKFTNEGGLIELKAKQVGDCIEISVIDSGIGIPNNKIDDLFGAGSNYNTTGTNDEKGSGLGLKICNDFVIANGGEIWVESQENKGSCFYFTLSTKN